MYSTSTCILTSYTYQHQVCPMPPLNSTSSKANWLNGRPVGAILSEPLSLFTLIGCALFLVNALFAPQERALLISDAEIEALLLLAELDKDAPLTTAEVETVTADYIAQQVLVAEAKVRGLDQDSRINVLLAEKMLHVLSAEVPQPSQTQLEEFYTRNQARYVQPESHRGEEIVLERNDKRELATVLETEPARIRPLPPLKQSELASIFSSAFADTAISAAPQWAGPFDSSRGRHWLRILETAPSYTPQLNEIIELVRADWLRQAEQRQERELTEELIKSYRITHIPSPQSSAEAAAQ